MLALEFGIVDHCRIDQAGGGTEHILEAVVIGIAIARCQIHQNKRSQQEIVREVLRHERQEEQRIMMISISLKSFSSTHWVIKYIGSVITVLMMLPKLALLSVIRLP